MFLFDTNEREKLVASVQAFLFWRLLCICSDLDYAAGMLISLRLSASKWICWYREMLFLNFLKWKKKLTVILSLCRKTIKYIDSGRSRQFFANNFSRKTNFAVVIQILRNRTFVTSRTYLFMFHGKCLSVNTTITCSFVTALAECWLGKTHNEPTMTLHGCHLRILCQLPSEPL